MFSKASFFRVVKSWDCVVKSSVLPNPNYDFLISIKNSRKKKLEPCSLFLIQDQTHLNLLPNNKILDYSKLKAFADKKINVTQKLNIVMGWVEKIVEKEENAEYQHFLLLPQCFQRISFSGSLKFGTVW